jgi:hypothetical protein
MNKKFVLITVILLLVISSIQAFGLIQSIENELIKNEKNQIFNNNPDFVIDQYNTERFCSSHGVWGSFKLAQSFTPTLETLSKVELPLHNKEQPYGHTVTISIRRDLTKNDLTSVALSDENFETYNTWITFDFPDIKVNPGSTYYIIWKQYVNPIKQVTVYWAYNNQQYTDEQAYIYKGSNWEEFSYRSYNSCDFGFITYGYDEPPNIPILNGPDNGEVGVNYTYSFSATDPEQHDISYKINWGDNTITDWMGLYNSDEICNASHKWECGGTYDIKVKAKDIYNLESDWSDPLRVIISGLNNPPDKPDKPIIEVKGKIDEEYIFSTTTIDLESHYIYYKWDWSDGISEWLGPYYSGEICEASHIWNEGGTYDIKVKAKDQCGSESPWSDPSSITLSKNKSLNEFNTWLFRLIQRYTILKCLL